MADSKLYRFVPAEADAHAEESATMYERALIAKKRAEAFLAEGDKERASILCTHGDIEPLKSSDFTWFQCLNCGSRLDGEPSVFGGSGEVVEPCAGEGKWSPLYLRNYRLN